MFLSEILKKKTIAATKDAIISSLDEFSEVEMIQHPLEVRGRGFHPDPSWFHSPYSSPQSPVWINEESV